MELNQISSTRQLLRAFGGLNETYGCSEAELSSAMNFSSRGYPALATRKHRRRVRDAADVGGMYHLNGVLSAEGTTLRYAPDDGSEAIVLQNAVSRGEKQMVGMGTKVIIFPDKIAFDTATRTAASLGATWAQPGSGTMTVAPCDSEGTLYTPKYTGSSTPSSPANGEVWLKQDPDAPWSYKSVMKVYSAAGSWQTVMMNYLRVECSGIGKAFKAGDALSLSGIPAPMKLAYSKALDGDAAVESIEDDVLILAISPDTESSLYYGKMTLSGGSVAWVSLDGKVEQSFDGRFGALTAARRVPDLDFLTECDNRVWGCSSKENVIYSCKLGDPTNWFSYRGIAADSYAVTVGSDGAFTGAATCMGYALFFKENTLHKLYGSKPSDFQLTSLRCRGVAKNAARSLCVLNETLYYLSPDGVMAWDGSIPTKVSGVLDSGRLSNVQSAVGGALDGRYYLHITRAAAGEGVARLLVYDTERALWSEEDVCSYEMTSTGGQLYLWDGQALWAADPSRETDWQSTDGVEEKLNFELVTGDIGLDGAEDRYLSRLTLRLDAECGSTVTVAASYDGGPWETVAELAAQNVRRSYDMPFVPRRHGTLRLRLKGRGQITLRSIAKTVAAAKGGITGGEV